MMISPPLKEEHKKYLLAFNAVRHMALRDGVKIPCPTREAAGLPDEARFCVVDLDHGNARIADYNRPPEGVPGLWCGWTVSDDGKYLQWDGVEKFYNYVEWLGFMMETFLISWGYTLEGMIDWQGEDPDDTGHIVIDQNRLNPASKTALEAQY
jgi:hypothetical protein